MIRAATAADTPAMLVLGRAMHAESRYAALPWDDAKVAELIGGLIASPDGLALVAEHDGVIVGGFLGAVDAHYFSPAKVATDFALFVAPDRRGGVLGAALLERFVAWAKARGAASVQVGITTGVHPERSARLLRACGFRDVGLLFEHGAAA